MRGFSALILLLIGIAMLCVAIVAYRQLSTIATAQVPPPTLEGYPALAWVGSDLLLGPAVQDPEQRVPPPGEMARRVVRRITLLGLGGLLVAGFGVGLLLFGRKSNRGTPAPGEP